MPLPILHTYAGYLAYKTAIRGSDTPSTDQSEISGSLLERIQKKLSAFSRGGRAPLLIACLILANLPDLDIIPGILFGHLGEYHRLISHSIGAAIIISLIATWILMKKGTGWKNSLSPFSVFGACFLSYTSHIALDIFNAGSKGVMALWPFTNKIFYGPLSLLGGRIDHSPLEYVRGVPEFIQILTSKHCVQTALIELAVIFLIWSILTAVKPALSERRHHMALAFQRIAAGITFLITSIMVT